MLGLPQAVLQARAESRGEFWSYWGPSVHLCNGTAVDSDPASKPNVSKYCLTGFSSDLNIYLKGKLIIKSFLLERKSLPEMEITDYERVILGVPVSEVTKMPVKM